MDIAHMAILLEFITSKALNKSVMFLHCLGWHAGLFRGSLIINKKVVTIFL